MAPPGGIGGKRTYVVNIERNPHSEMMEKGRAEGTRATIVRKKGVLDFSGSGEMLQFVVSGESLLQIICTLGC